MGLDMYLYRTKKVDGVEPDEYRIIDNVVSETHINNFKSIKTAFEKYNKRKEVKEVGVERKYKDIYENLKDVVKIRGEYTKWLSIFDFLGDWRKANQIHNFFVTECQDGEDDCNLYLVTKENLLDLLIRCEKVLRLKNIYLNEGVIQGESAEEILPSKDGFYFGGTEFDEWYFMNIERTIKIVKTTLKETDFEKQVIFYQSSW